MNVAGPARVRSVPLASASKRGSLAFDGGAGSSAADVNMYNDIPSFELSLDDFEEYALARLKVGLHTRSCILCGIISLKRQVLPSYSKCALKVHRLSSVMVVAHGGATSFQIYYASLVTPHTNGRSCARSRR